jgi:hypothetical protein
MSDMFAPLRQPGLFGVGGGEKPQTFGFIWEDSFDPNLVKAGDEGYSYQENFQRTKAAEDAEIADKLAVIK